MSLAFNLEKSLLENIESAKEEITHFAEKGENFAVFEGYREVSGDDDVYYFYIVDTRNGRFIGEDGTYSRFFVGHLDDLLERDVSFNRLNSNLIISETFTKPALSPRQEDHYSLANLIKSSKDNIFMEDGKLPPVSFENMFELVWQSQSLREEVPYWPVSDKTKKVNITLAQDVEMFSLQKDDSRCQWRPETIAKKGEEVSAYFNTYTPKQLIIKQELSGKMFKLYQEDVVLESVPEGVELTSMPKSPKPIAPANLITKEDVSVEDLTFGQLVQKASEKTGFAYSAIEYGDETVVTLFNKDGRVLSADFRSVQKTTLERLEDETGTINQAKAKRKNKKKLTKNLASLSLEPNDVKNHGDLEGFNHAGVGFDLMQKGLSFEQCFDLLEQVAGKRSFENYSLGKIHEPTSITILKDIEGVFFDEATSSVIEKTVAKKGDIIETSAYGIKKLPIGDNKFMWLKDDEYELLNPPVSPTSETVKEKLAATKKNQSVDPSSKPQV